VPGYRLDDRLHTALGRRPSRSGEIVEAALDAVMEPLCDSTWEIGLGVDLIPATSTISTSASLGV
jgi:hypothetical protein